MGKNKFKVLTLVSFTFVCLAILSGTAQAATLYFSPSSGSYTVGSLITLNIYISSEDQAINAASGVISFPQDKLEAVSLSKAGSIFNLWVQEPSFSNSAGTVDFEGIVLNPGFTGSGGKILTITFKTKTTGNVPLSFFSGSILANDGKGTNILTSLGNAQFILGGTSQNIPETSTPSVVSGAPSSPIISSPTHPDSNKWYLNNDAKFVWEVPASVISARLLVGKIPNAVPSVVYTPAVGEKEIEDLTDGIWYFHAQLRNMNGWGDVSHFRLQIDTEKPTSFNIQEIERDDPTNPRAKFDFEARDETSGISHYEIQIDEDNLRIWEDDGSNIYETPILRPGAHIMIVKAVDKAGNALANSVDFIIEALETPKITEYPKELQSEEVFIVRGTTYPNAQVALWLQREKEDPRSYIVNSDQDGNFTFVADEKLKDGIYKLWAEAVDERGARSNPTEKITVVVEQGLILRIGSQAITVLAVIIPLIALIIFLIIVVWYSWRKFSSLKESINKETKEAEQALHRAVRLLKEDVESQLKMLGKAKSKRELTEEEAKIVKQIKKDLDSAEKFISKEIQDIKKKVK